MIFLIEIVLKFAAIDAKRFIMGVTVTGHTPGSGDGSNTQPLPFFFYRCDIRVKPDLQRPVCEKRQRDSSLRLE